MRTTNFGLALRQAIANRILVQPDPWLEEKIRETISEVTSQNNFEEEETVSTRKK